MVQVVGPAGTQTAAAVPILAVAPALFTLNGSGLASSYATRVSGSSQITEPAYALNVWGSYSAAPISLGGGSDQTYLVLYGSGFDSATTSNTSATVNGVNASVLFAGPTGIYSGVDQVVLQLPASLAGKGNVNVQVSVMGVRANAAQVTIQ